MRTASQIDLGMESLAILTLVPGAATAAEFSAPWKVAGKLIGKTKDGDVKKAEDVSGFACTAASDFRANAWLSTTSCRPRNSSPWTTEKSLSENRSR